MFGWLRTLLGFDRPELTREFVQELAREAPPRVVQLARERRTIEAIKLHRELTGSRLAEAHAVVTWWTPTDQRAAPKHDSVMQTSVMQIDTNTRKRARAAIRSHAFVEAVFVLADEGGIESATATQFAKELADEERREGRMQRESFVPAAMAPADREALTRALKRLRRRLEEADEGAFVTLIDIALESEDAWFRRFLTSSSIWGGAGSMVDQAGIGAKRRTRTAIRGALAELANAIDEHFPDDDDAQRVIHRV